MNASAPAVRPALPAAPVRLIQADCVPPQPWRNGGGITRELLRLPEDAATWELRISLADIEADGPFSAFPGIDRHFAVIGGAGVRLQFRHRVHAAVRGDPPIAFDGAEAPDCHVTDGVTQDLNVMADRRAGMAGLVRAETGVPWEAPADVARGLFAADAVRLSRGGTDTYSLPARTLLWCDGGDGQPWTIEPGATAAHEPVGPAPLAFWITWARVTPPRGGRR